MNIRINIGQTYKNILKVATGTASAQAITLLSIPLITRFYEPDTFGAQSLFLAVVAFASTVVSLSYHIAIVIAPDASEAGVITKATVAKSIYGTAILYFLFLICPSKHLNSIGLGSILPYQHLLPVAILVANFSLLATQWSIRLQSYGANAVANVAGSVASNITKLVFGVLNPTGHALVSANIFGTLVSGILTFNTHRREIIASVIASNHSSAIQVIKKYSDFAIYRTPQNAISVITQSAPLFLLSAQFGASVTGQFALAQTILAGPANLIGNSVYAVLYPQVSKSIASGISITKQLVKSTGWMVIFGISMIFPILVSGPELFQVLFGSSWGQAGAFSRWLAVLVVFQFANRPVVSAIPALNMQRWLLRYEVVGSSAKISSLFGAAALGASAELAIAIFCLLGAGFYIWLIYSVIKRSSSVGVGSPTP